MSRRGWVLFTVMCLVWGLPYLLIKVAVGTFSPAALVFVRTGTAALVLLPLAAMRGQLRPLLPRWKPLVAYTVAELAVPWLLLSSAERRITSSLAGLLIAAVPLVGALLARIAGGHEPLGVRRLAGLLVGLAGVAALVGTDYHGGNAVAFGEIAVVAVGYALGPFILARYLSDLPGLGVVAASLVLTAVAYAPVGIAQLPSRWPAATVTGAVIVLALLCTAVAFLVFFALIGEVGPVRTTIITYVNPAVAVALGVAFLGEPFTLGIAVAFVLILAGSVLATGRSRGSATATGGASASGTAGAAAPVAVAEP
ncbi:EamA family transporter [Planosporangium thailandense]|uniref:EamA family transporter n=1 Tax=Planosporangium thailandense TaxID=765197 RepID=UPI00197BD2E6